MTGGQVASSPAVANGIVYVGSYDDKLYALNATSGTCVWTYTTEGTIVSSPAVANSIVYVGSYDHVFYAFGSLSSKQHISSSFPVTLLLIVVSIAVALSILAAVLYSKKRRTLGFCG